MQCFAEHSCLHVAATIWAARPLTLTQQSEMYESTGICYAQPCWEDKSQHFEEGITDKLQLFMPDTYLQGI